METEESQFENTVQYFDTSPEKTQHTCKIGAQTKQTPTIEVQARDFLASLSRIIQINDAYFKKMFENDKMSRERLTKDLNVYCLCEFNSVNI